MTDKQVTLLEIHTGDVAFNVSAKNDAPLVGRRAEGATARGEADETRGATGDETGDETADETDSSRLALLAALALLVLAAGAARTLRGGGDDELRRLDEFDDRAE